MTNAFLRFIAVMSVFAMTIANAATFEVKIPEGKTVDVARYVNVKGSLKILIRTRDGSNTLPAAWWIKWGFGSVSQIGPQKNSFTTKIPVNKVKGIASAKLRATAGSDTVLYLSEDSELDASVTFHW